MKNFIKSEPDLGGLVENSHALYEAISTGNLKKINSHQIGEMVTVGLDIISSIAPGLGPFGPIISSCCSITKGVMAVFMGAENDRRAEAARKAAIEEQAERSASAIAPGIRAQNQ